MPQGFTKLGSVIFAIPAMSETRLVCVNVGVIDAADDCRNMATAAEAIPKTKSIRATPNELPFFTRTLLGFGVNLISVGGLSSSFWTRYASLQHACGC